MLKRFIIAALMLSVVATAAACSSDSKKDSAASPSVAPSAAATAAASSAPSENPDTYKLKAYTAARIADEKITLLFQSTTVEEKAVMNSVIATDKEKAVKFLNAYLDPALSEKVASFYLTADKTKDGSVIVKTDKFLPTSILTVAPTKADITFEGTEAEVKMTTKDNVVFTAKKNSEGKYIISDVAKK